MSIQVIIFIILSTAQINICWKAKVCDQRNYYGECLNLSGTSCKNLTGIRWCPITGLEIQACNQQINNHISSVNTMGGCIRLYNKVDCKGLSVALHAGNKFQADLRLPGFDNLASSIGPCFTDDGGKNCKKPQAYIGRKGGRSKREMSSRCSFFNDIITVGPVPGLLTQTLRGNGPVIHYQRGYNNRVEYVEAIIQRQHLRITERRRIIQRGTGSGTTTATRRYARMMGRRNDDAGHVIGLRLGGSGSDSANIFPQSPNFNRGVWAQDVEDMVYNAVLAYGSVRYSVNLRYTSPFHTRPFSLVYRIEYTDRNGEHMVFQNDVLNP